MRISQADLTTLSQSILSNRKYASTGLLPTTVEDVLRQEFSRHSSQAAAISTAKRKLHNICAAYLGNPDYAKALVDIDTAFTSGEESRLEFCRSMLASHDSTHERMPIMEELYRQVFAITGQPQSLADLACGLNPFALPWMGLTRLKTYHAYDIIQPRIDLINRFFMKSGLPPSAYCRDILVEPPAEHTDVTLLFKEAHRIEQRCHNANRALFQALNTNWLVISLPPSSLSRQHDLADGMRRLVARSIDGFGWHMQELTFDSELIFIVQKSHG